MQEAAEMAGASVPGKRQWGSQFVCTVRACLGFFKVARVAEVGSCPPPRQAMLLSGHLDKAAQTVALSHFQGQPPRVGRELALSFSQALPCIGHELRIVRAHRVLALCLQRLTESSWLPHGVGVLMHTLQMQNPTFRGHCGN